MAITQKLPLVFQGYYCTSWCLVSTFLPMCLWPPNYKSVLKYIHDIATAYKTITFYFIIITPLLRHRYKAVKCYQYSFITCNLMF